MCSYSSSSILCPTARSASLHLPLSASGTTIYSIQSLDLWSFNLPTPFLSLPFNLVFPPIFIKRIDIEHKWCFHCHRYYLTCLIFSGFFSFKTSSTSMGSFLIGSFLIYYNFTRELPEMFPLSPILYHCPYFTKDLSLVHLCFLPTSYLSTVMIQTIKRFHL